jgi:hypothetical protein
MITREDAIKRIEGIEQELAHLREELAQPWADATPEERTREFLRKCGGWEDSRTAEEIVADIYSSRTVSDRGAHIFDEEQE